MSNEMTRGGIAEDETVIAAAPFVVRRTVKWGDTDPAGVVYTPRFLHFAVEAVESWFTSLTGRHWRHLPEDYGIETPPIAANLRFRHALWPDDRLDLTVRVTAIGRSSYTVAVAGANQDGVACFEANLTFVAIDPAARKSVPLPDRLRTALETYRTACGPDGA